MLTFCGFLILMLIGFMFVKEDNKKKIIKLMKEKATLIGAGLFLLFLINGISGYENMNKSDFFHFLKVAEKFTNIEGLSHKIEGLTHEDDDESLQGNTCGDL